MIKQWWTNKGEKKRIIIRENDVKYSKMEKKKIGTMNGYFL